MPVSCSFQVTRTSPSAAISIGPLKESPLRAQICCSRGPMSRLTSATSTWPRHSACSDCPSLAAPKFTFAPP